MYESVFNIAANQYKCDSKDCKIVNYLLENPNASHKEIGALVNTSQPTIGIRIKSMIKSKVLRKSYLINFDKNAFAFLKVDVETNNPDFLINSLFLHPNVIEAYKLTGDYNVSLIIVGESCKDANNFSEKYVIKNVIKYKQEFILNKLSKPISYE